MAITEELLDQLIADYKKPENLIGENGLLKQLTKRLLERAMQAWTASMWAILWELYKREMAGQITIQSHPAMNFCWATDPVERYNHTNILHMSGVTEQQPHLFHKGTYTTAPHGNPTSPTSCPVHAA